MAICFNTLADDETNQRRVKGERRDGNDPTQGPRLALGIMLRKADHSQRNGRCSDESEVGLKFNVVCCTMKTCGTAVEMVETGLAEDWITISGGMASPCGWIQA